MSVTAQRVRVLMLCSCVVVALASSPHSYITLFPMVWSFPFACLHCTLLSLPHSLLQSHHPQSLSIAEHPPLSRSPSGPGPSPQSTMPPQKRTHIATTCLLPFISQLWGVCDLPGCPGPPLSRPGRPPPVPLGPQHLRTEAGRRGWGRGGPGPAAALSLCALTAARKGGKIRLVMRPRTQSLRNHTKSAGGCVAMLHSKGRQKTKDK